MKTNKMTKDEFVMRMILIFFSKYRNMQDEINTKTPTNKFYSWDEMLDFTDPKRDKSFEVWRACLQLWDTPEDYLDFFAQYVLDYKSPLIKEETESRLTMNDAEHIFSLACVMGYALEKRSHFYEELKAELQNTVFGLTGD